MKILVINAGSSSLKFTVFNFTSLEDLETLASGQVECIGLPTPRLIYIRANGTKTTTDIEISKKHFRAKKYLTHRDALERVCKKLLDPAAGVLANIGDIKAIGHRTVHGGEKITETTIIDENVKKIVEECIDLAPLHNPPGLAGIEACEKIFPGTPNVGVFDTAFHQTMPPESYVYAIPYELYTKHGIRRYGFHGTSHHYVAQATADYLGIPFEKLKLITCHLGNGASMAAINKGKVIDTSMGLTPLEGLVMGTRCGDIDPGVILGLFEIGMSPKEVDETLNKKSGLLGIAGINTGDFRDVLAASVKGSEQAELAIKIFVNRIVKYIGAYSVLLDGADAIIFTGGIGEHSYSLRKRVVEKISSLGINLDKKVNSSADGKQAAIISTPKSKVKAVVMPTNEELMIAKESIELLHKKKMLTLSVKS